MLPGLLTVQIPPYMELEHDEATRKAVVKIQDAQQRDQREMWG
jgi:large subunit ribosomal protein L6